MNKFIQKAIVLNQESNYKINDFPEDLIQFFKGLRTKFRISLTLMLYTKGSSSLSEICKNLNVKSGYLVNQLKILELSGIVQNFIEKRSNTKQYSFYEITEYGFRLLEGIIKCYRLLRFEKILWKDNYYKNKIVINELELLFKGLSNRFRIELLLHLYKGGALSFSNIVNMTKKEKSSITKHLKKLEICGLIQNFLKKSNDTSDYSFYEVTEFGSEIITNLIHRYNEYYQLLPIEEKKHRFNKKYSEAESKIYFI